MEIFKCVECGKAIKGFVPEKCECGYITPVSNGVYQFTSDSPVSIENGPLKWMGYENIGVNYEPGYALDKDHDKIGGSEKLANFLGTGRVILDLGAGLGGSSISFARSGLRAIAADISQTMLEASVERAKAHHVPPDQIIFARMNGYKLEIADGCMDAVIATDVLHQVDHPELVADEIKRVLKPDGFFLMYGKGRSLGYTESQQEANERYNLAQKDIHDFYDKMIANAGYGHPPFSSANRAADCVNESFSPYITLENTGMYGADHLIWPLKFGLHKMKTRASGVKQLIPSEIHQETLRKTDEYAKAKYGENYEEMVRYFNYTYDMIVCKRRS